MRPLRHTHDDSWALAVVGLAGKLRRWATLAVEASEDARGAPEAPPLADDDPLCLALLGVLVLSERLDREIAASLPAQRRVDETPPEPNLTPGALSR
ncbi:MAG: hypothetical protein R3B72_32095 [Polyangiaceae bacterium]